MLGSGCLYESSPCCLFICFDVFLVTEARNECVVGLGVSVNAEGYFHTVLLQCAPHKQPLEPGSDQK